MTPDERQLITGLFDRMRSFGAPDKDREAEALINQPMRANPDATYMLVQSVLVQEQALEAANNRVQELEEQLRSLEEGDRPRGARSGGFLGGFWGGRRGEEPRSSVPQVGARATPSAYDSRGDGRSPWAQSAARRSNATAGAGSRLGRRLHALGADHGRRRRRRHAGGRQHPQHAGRRRARQPASRRRRWRRRRAEDARYADDRDNDPGSEPAAYEDDGNDPGFDSGGGGDLEI